MFTLESEAVEATPYAVHVFRTAEYSYYGHQPRQENDGWSSFEFCFGSSFIIRIQNVVKMW